jgi:hypothetical protein
MRLAGGIFSKQQKTWGIVLFLAGILFALTVGDFDAADSLLGTANLRSLSVRAVDGRELFLTLLWERGRLFFLLLLLCQGTCRRFAEKAVPVLLVILLGLYAGVCLACQGIWGAGLFFFSVFPHGIVYLLALNMVLHKKKPVQYSGTRYMFTEVASVFVIIAIVAAGCLLEATAGSFLLKNYLLAFISAIS